MAVFVLSDPQAYSVKPGSDSVPTIQVDLASPQSPDSVNMMDEFARGASGGANKQQDEEEAGLMMKPPVAAAAAASEADKSRDQQKLMRCLSDPGPSADEDEDDPFLP